MMALALAGLDVLGLGRGACRTKGRVVTVSVSLSPPPRRLFRPQLTDRVDFLRAGYALLVVNEFLLSLCKLWEVDYAVPGDTKKQNGATAERSRDGRNVAHQSPANLHTQMTHRNGGSILDVHSSFPYFDLLC